MRASVHLDTEHHVGPIDRRIFEGFLEHMGRAVYEGVYDPGNPLSDERGFRRDVLEALRPLGMPVMRYPGGNFVSFSDWRDGIGPKDQRPVRPDYAWRTIETNQFGLDEFIDWSATLGTRPLLAVNLGTRGTDEAAQLVEYCNLPGGTSWSDRRRRNGHAAPYDVTLWCLGNEMDGIWQAGHVPAAVYAQRAGQAGIVMKGLDPTIETIVCGSSGQTIATYMEWDRTVLEYCWDYVDYIAAHRYSENKRGDSAWFLAEGIAIDRTLDDYAALLGYVRAVKKSDKRVYLAFDEWNVYYRDRTQDGKWAPAPHLVEEVYNLEDALVCAQYLASFIRHADVVKVACLAQIVNVVAPILTRPDGLLLQTIYYPFALFSRYAVGLSLVPVVRCSTYGAGERGEVPVLDAAASYNPDAGTGAIFLVNRSQEERLEVDVRVVDRRIERIVGVESLGGGDVKAINTWERPGRVGPSPGTATVTDDGVTATLLKAIRYDNRRHRPALLFQAA